MEVFSTTSSIKNCGIPFPCWMDTFGPLHPKPTVTWRRRRRVHFTINFDPGKS
jgi:hypothetical protein